MGLGAGGEGGVSFPFLLGREKTGGESCQDDIKMMGVRKQEALRKQEASLWPLLCAGALD